MNEEIYYSIALTRLTGVNHAMLLQSYQEMGNAEAVYEQTKDRFSWDDALHRAAAEMEFITKNSIQVLTLHDPAYPRRLSECPDAPIVLYYMGTTDLNQLHIINMVGTASVPPMDRT